VGLDWDRFVHWSQCPRRRMVRWSTVMMVGLELTLDLAMKGNLRYRFLDSRWWCASTPDTDQEFD
jgi:hypothetical protein